jgi:hypothetical protein
MFIKRQGWIKGEVEMFNIKAEACSCRYDCRKFVEPIEYCVCYQAREADMAVMPCSVCSAGTWHRNGECSRCQRRKEGYFVD